MKTLVKLENISHSFESSLYKDINLIIKERESVAILGVSGSGKSTILNSIASLLKPKNGKISLCEYDDIYSLKDEYLLFLRRKILGIIFQSHYLFRGFSTLENLQVAEIISENKIDSKMLEKFEIAHTLNQQIGELSGGQQQRLSIARVLTKKPKVLIADEPTGNLDKNTATVIIKYLIDYVKSEHAALIIATHDIEIAQMCSKIYRLRNEKIEQIDLSIQTTT